MALKKIAPGCYLCTICKSGQNIPLGAEPVPCRCDGKPVAQINLRRTVQAHAHERKLEQSHAGVCIHRGEKLRDEKCRLCGRRGQVEPVYQCAIFGECTHRKYRVPQQQQSCLTCPRWEDPTAVDDEDGHDG